MDFEVFSRIVKEIHIKKPVWFGLKSEVKSTAEEISEVEDCLSIKLPEEYKQFIKNYGGGYFAFTIVYSVKKNSEWYLVTRNINTGFFKTVNLLIISDNEVGDYYGFKVIDGKCSSRVFYYDHHEDQVKPTGYSDFYEYLIQVGLTS